MLSYLISSQSDRINGYPLRESAVDSQNLGDYPQENSTAIWVHLTFAEIQTMRTAL